MRRESSGGGKCIGKCEINNRDSAFDLNASEQAHILMSEAVTETVRQQHKSAIHLQTCKAENHPAEFAETFPLLRSIC